MKRGYFFVLDGIFAVVILVIGLIMISSNIYTNPAEVPLISLSDDLLDLLSSTQVSELCYDYEECICSNRKIEELCTNHLIFNPDQSILDYFGELYTKDYKEIISQLYQNITKDIIKHNIIGSELIINDEKIYPNYDTTSSKNESDFLISSKRIIFSYYEEPESGDVSFWGPYLIEIRLWEK